MTQSTGLQTQPFPPHPRSADELLEIGLLDLWYVVARAADVTDRPVALRRLSRNLVLWRDASGRIAAVEDYCPHRGAPLSLGRVVAGNLACPYHGIQLSRDGVVTAVPPTPGCPLVGERAIRSYPCREFAGAIWVYFADDADATPPEPIFPEEISGGDWWTFLHAEPWKAHWQTVWDNLLDPIHGSFLHDDTFTLSGGRKDAHLQIAATPQGFELSRDNQRGLNLDWLELSLHPGNGLWLRTEVPYPPSFGGSFWIHFRATPIDPGSTFVAFFRSRRISGWRRDMWRFLYRNRIAERNQRVLDQDRVLLERIPREAVQREKLIQTDIGVARVRRLLREEAARQIAARSGSRSAAE